MTPVQAIYAARLAPSGRISLWTSPPAHHLLAFAGVLDEKLDAIAHNTAARVSTSYLANRLIRDDVDLENHVVSIHFNRVKHSCVNKASD